MHGNERFAKYLRPDELHLGFNFRLVQADFDAREVHVGKRAHQLVIVGRLGPVVAVAQIIEQTPLFDGNDPFAQHRQDLAADIAGGGDYGDSKEGV